MIIAPDYINSSGDASLYGAPDGDWPSHGLDLLRASGYSLTRPNASTVAVTEGGERAGEGTEMSEVEFLRRLQAEESLSFRLWSPSRDDMFCTFRHLPSGWVESYVIGSAVRDEAEAFVGRLLQRFMDDTASGERMLLVDWASVAVDFDWDELWDSRNVYTGPLPDIVGVPNRLRSAFRSPDVSVELPAPPGYTVLRRP